MAQTNANLIWKIADLLRGPYQPNQYGELQAAPSVGSALAFTVLRMSTMSSTSGSANTDFRARWGVIGVGRFVEPRRFHDAVGGEFVDDQVDEPDLSAVNLVPSR